MSEDLVGVLQRSFRVMSRLEVFGPRNETEFMRSELPDYSYLNDNKVVGILTDITRAQGRFDVLVYKSYARIPDPSPLRPTITICGEDEDGNSRQLVKYFLQDLPPAIEIMDYDERAEVLRWHAEQLEAAKGTPVTKT